MSAEIAASTSRLLSRVAAIGRQPRVYRSLAVALLAAALLSGLATYAAVTGKLAVPANMLPLLFLLDLVFLPLLATVVAWQLVTLWLERRRGLVGARLHVRLVLWFSLVAIAPVVIISVFSVMFFVFSWEIWFGDSVRTAIGDSLSVAESYVREHQENVARESLAMAEDLRNLGPFDLDRLNRYQGLLNFQNPIRRLDLAAIIDDTGRVLTSTDTTAQARTSFDVPPKKIEIARRGEAVILSSPVDDRIRAVVLVDRDANAFLYTERQIDSRVVSHMQRVQISALYYGDIEGQRGKLLTSFSLIFVVVALLLLLAAVWAALVLATRLVRPISRLVVAADKIGAGDLATRVQDDDPRDEIGVLSRAFNRMTGQIESQRNELMDANTQLEERRRFMEVVLAGVSAGVIGLDEEGCINLPNRSASDLLTTDLMARIGEPIAGVVPEMAPLVEAARQRPSWLAESQISLVRGAETRTLLVRVVAEFMAARLIGFVVTFDDVTELLSAQRKAAWADVARRIAHEIKNPLTPIQLSAERLKRKYLKEISSDPETFTTCTDTIVRQVGDIGRMVDEFSAFARMPAPVMAPENLVELCHRAIFLQQSANPSISYKTDFPATEVRLNCDAQQIGQALMNLLKNAAESIEARSNLGNSEPPGQIGLNIRESEDDLTLTIEDNGRGLPDQGRERLTEPYVTTRGKGTGLGLAIVKKIAEDHGALLQLDDRPGGGAIVRLTFRLSKADGESESGNSDRPELAQAHGS
ncbi:MAG TPA: PAS domain-containing sensor histidine kinase [Methylomirabilota bacterium]|nr:PAS domain-containing sensor histidine kinase [Methylomirabilota bacterium]